MWGQYCFVKSEIVPSRETFSPVHAAAAAQCTIFIVDRAGWFSITAWSDLSDRPIAGVVSFIVFDSVVTLLLLLHSTSLQQRWLQAKDLATPHRLTDRFSALFFGGTAFTLSIYIHRCDTAIGFEVLGSSHTSSYSVHKENLLALVVLYNSPSTSPFRGRLPERYSNFPHWEVITSSLASLDLIYTVARTYTDSEGHCPHNAVIIIGRENHIRPLRRYQNRQRKVKLFVKDTLLSSIELGCSILDVTWLRHDSIVTQRGPDQSWIHETITNRVCTSHHNINRQLQDVVNRDLRCVMVND